jgi:hypothetical protein
LPAILVEAFTKLNHFASAKEVATAGLRSWLAKITANSASFPSPHAEARMVALEGASLAKNRTQTAGKIESYARRERSHHSGSCCGAAGTS